ncbi:MAG: outer membrane protein OmpA-like peptidoglycan-associated protein [Kiritimatiellia bacterium]|jgi:outer membrane protein OmpA-like peptidoglycan-associated protein
MLVRSLIAVLALSTPALADDGELHGGMNAHGFVLAAQDGDVRDGYMLQRPGSMYAGTWYAGGVLEYANKPLVVVTERSGDVLSTDPLLDHVLGLNLTAGVAPHERLRFGVSVPLYFTSTSLENSQGAGIGDMRLDAMVLLIPQTDDEGFGLGLVPWLDMPTGASAKYLGRDKLGGGAALAATYGMERATLTANLGAQFDPEIEGLLNMTGSDSLVAGLGANYLVSANGALGAEARFFMPLQSNDQSGTGAPSEAIVSYRRRSESGGFFSLGGAMPLSTGAGAAAFRVFVGGGFGKTGALPPGDKDRDGLTDDVDQCVTEPETVNDYKDQDGCPDELPGLQVKVTFDGEQVPGATLIATPEGGEPVTVQTTSSDYGVSSMPGTSWVLSANKADCLVGEASAQMSDGPSTAEVALTLDPSADLKIFVHDEQGAPVPGVRIAWESSEPLCLPAETPTIGDDGRGGAMVGPGSHTLIVTADGYRMVEQPVELKKGENAEVEVVLATTKLKIEAKRIAILDKVEFQTNQAVLQSSSFALLDEVSAVIRRNPSAGRVEVQGHTDSEGPAEYNQALSERRAATVLDYLVSKGVERQRLISAGYGETKAIDSNDSASGRSRNRRVEFVLIDQDSEVIDESGK